MPLLIAALMGGMIYFYFESDPNRMKEAEEAGFAETIQEPGKFSELAPVAPFPSGETPEAPSAKTTDSTPVAPPIPAVAVEVEGPDLPTDPTGSEQPFNRQFTPWLSPLALDTYMRAKDQGHTVGFWDRGHWITAIEGRWRDGSHEFRIRFDKTPQKPNWRWQYRINLTPDEFLATHAEMRRKGFSLVQSQSFQHPDQRRRYQAVWQSDETTAPALASNSSSGSTPSTQATEIYGPPASLRSAPRSTEPLFGETERGSVVIRRGDTPGRDTVDGNVLDVNRLPFR